MQGEQKRSEEKSKNKIKRTLISSRTKALDTK